MSYLAEEEVEALQGSGLCRKTPYLITGVSRTQFSISRHYGGCTYQARRYIYIPPTDELVRDDVVKWIAKRRKAQSKVTAKAAKAAQGKLF